MEQLPKRIHENGIDYILVGDYYIPDLKLPEENRPIGKYGSLHRTYLKECHSARYSNLILTGELWTYLADLNEQAQERLDTIMEQMKWNGCSVAITSATGQKKLFMRNWSMYKDGGFICKKTALQPEN